MYKIPAVSSTLRMWAAFLFLCVQFGIASAQAQIFENFGFRSGSGKNYAYVENWTARQNGGTLPLGWEFKNKELKPSTSCTYSGDLPSSTKFSGGYGLYTVSAPKEVVQTLGEHRLTVTCSDDIGNTETRTAILTIENGYKILDFYVDAASEPVQVGSDIIFRWEMTPADLRCYVSYPARGWDFYPRTASGAGIPGATSMNTATIEYLSWQDPFPLPNAVGEAEFRLTCGAPDGKTSPAAITGNVKVPVVAQTSSNKPVFEEFWLSSTRITTLQNATLTWAVSGADSCTAAASGGDWSGTQNASGATTLSGLSKGDYTYTLTCQNMHGTSARTVTLKVTDPPAAKITRFEFNGSRKNDQGQDTIQAGETASLRWAVSNAASCTVTGTGFSGLQPLTTAGIALNDAVINTGGDHAFTLTCQGVDGGDPASDTLTLTVVPADEILQFFVDEAASIREPNGKLVLRWVTQPADLTCTVYTNNADWPQKETGLIELVFPPTYGDYPYELRCGDQPLTQSLLVKLEDTTPPPTNLSGQYFGRHTQVMALADRPLGDGSSFNAGIAMMQRIDGSGRLYNVLGENITEAYWLWDFDKGQIHLGGSNLRALDIFIPPYRLYSPDRGRVEDEYGAPAQFFPEADLPLSEQIGTFEDRGNGLYAVKFNLQIFFSPAGYPLARMELLMRIGKNDDGTLRITTLDEHPDGRTWFDEVNPYLEEHQRVAVSDGIPGVVLPALSEVYPEGHLRAGQPMDNRGFPMRISPWFFSERMVKVDAALSPQGIPKTILEAMRMDPALDDQDGDGITDKEEVGKNWVLPRQTALDGIYDMLKPRQFDGKPHFAGQIVLGNGERIVLYKEDKSALPFYPFENTAPVAFWRELLPHWLAGGPEHHPYFYTAGGDNPRLPAVNMQGQTLHYDLGMLWVQSSADSTGSGFSPFNIYFASGVPEGLVIYDLRERWGVENGEKRAKRTASFAEVEWQPVNGANGHPDGKTIQILSIPKHAEAPGVYSARLVMAHTQANRKPVFDGADPTYLALLKDAETYTYTPEEPPDVIVLMPAIVNFSPSATSVALGKSVRLRWNSTNADSCTLVYGGASVSVPLVGNHAVTPNALGKHTYELMCTKHVPAGVGGYDHPRDYEVRRTTSVQVLTEAEIGNNHAAELVGVWVGDHRATMYGCPGACVAGQEAILGQGIRNARWVWDFNAQTVQITGTTLTVGFNYEVQAPGNQGEGELRLTAPFTNNGDGTYTVDHGFQIYNPGVGNPRADTSTTFRMTVDTENPDRIDIVTIDGDGDGIRGNQIAGVFPMTIQPVFDGMAVRDTTSTAGDGILDSVKLALGLNPDAINGDTDGDGIPDKMELGPDLNNPIDSDGDGIIDALEPGEAAHDAKTAAGFALLGGIPGRTEEALPLSGTTARASVAGDWRFTGVDTGLLELTNPNDAAGAIPDVSMGDVGLKYQHGFVQVKLRSEQLEPVLPHGAAALSAAGGEFAPMAAPVAAPLTFTLTYQAALPPVDTLLVYATERVDGRERYTKMDQGWRRVDDYTLEVTVSDNGPRDMDDGNGYLRVGIAPAANALGGYNQASGNASGGGGHVGLWLLLTLLGLAGVRRYGDGYGVHMRRRRAHAHAHAHVR